MRHESKLSLVSRESCSTLESYFYQQHMWTGIAYSSPYTSRCDEQYRNYLNLINMKKKESAEVPTLLFSWSVPVFSHAVTSATLLKTLSRALSLSLSLALHYISRTINGLGPTKRQRTFCLIGKRISDNQTKLARSDYQRHVRPSVRPPSFNSAPTGQIFMKIHIWVSLENLSEK
jgi:hypothetical protein